MPVSAITSGSRVTSTNRLHYAVTAEQVARVPEEQRQAFTLLVGLAQQQDVR